MDLEGLSTICADLGIVELDDNGATMGYTKSEFCLDNLKDLQRFLRRDDPQMRDVFKQICKWNTVKKDLIPIIEHCQDDRDLVISAVKVLVFLTMPIDPASNDISQQIEHLWGLKTSLTRNDTVAVIVSLLEDPLQNLEREMFTEDDWKLVQLVLTLFRNILAIQDITLQQKASGSGTQFLSLRDRFLELLFHENVMDLVLVLTQHVGDSCGYFHEDNLLLLEIFHYVFLGQEPKLIAKASRQGAKADEDVTLKSIIEDEDEKWRATKLRNLERHSQFSGMFTLVAMDGCKTLYKGNPTTAPHESLLKPHKIQRGPLKRIVWDNKSLSSSKNILEFVHDFVNQFLLGGYNVLMQSIREDIEKEHHAIQNGDVVVFFKVAQFITAFQHHKFLALKPAMEIDASEGFVDKYADSTFFQGDICGPIAATMNEAMFLLVISKWRNTFEGLRETHDYKFLSASGSLMKNMIRMLDLVLKLLPEDSKEPQTARILLYKIFYDQTEEGMTQFLMNLMKSFDTRKQPKSDLADLVEMIHVIVRLMENLQARGTLRVSRKSRKGRKKKIMGDSKATEDERLGDDHVSEQNDLGNSTSDPSPEMSMPLEERLTNSVSESKGESTLAPSHVEKFEIHIGNREDNSVQMYDKKFSHGPESPDDLADGTDDYSDDDQPAATEVDFKVSSLVSTFAQNTIIQNLCWLLKFYKSNSTSTNHYILCMLRRICNDLELSPMLYQLSLLTTFNDILVEQKSSACKEYADIVCFITNLVREMLKKMKSQPLLFVEILFWKTRRECHYINSESLLHELGNLKKETRSWGSVSVGDEGKIGLSQGKVGPGRSIADLFGDDEAEFMVSHELNNQEEDPYEAKLQKVLQRTEDSVGKVKKSLAYISSSDIDMAENLDSDNLRSKEHCLEHESLRVSRRKKRLIFDEEMESDIKNLHEKYKGNRHCSRLIAEALDPDGKVSPVQVSNKLKQLGLKVTSRKRMLHVDGSFPRGDDQNRAERKELQSDNTLLNSNEFQENSFLRRSSHSRKRIRAFSKEQELMVKDLFEQFKDHKKCSHMIANALDAENTFTAGQISYKLKQLGLRIPQQKRISEAKKHSRSKDAEGLVTDEKEEESDEETLVALQKRSKNKGKGKLYGEEVTTKSVPEQKIESTPSQDDSDDEMLSSILKKTSTRLLSKTLDEKLTTIGESKLYSEEVTTKSVPKQKIENTPSEDDPDDEILSSILKKTSRRLLSKTQDEKLTISSVQKAVLKHHSSTGPPQGMIERDARDQSNEMGSLHIDESSAVVIADLDENAEAEVAGISSSRKANVAVDNANYVQHEQIQQELADELFDSADDIGPVAPKNVVLRRKLRMVVDLEDE